MSDTPTDPPSTPPTVHTLPAMPAGTPPFPVSSKNATVLRQGQGPLIDSQGNRFALVASAGLGNQLVINFKLVDGSKNIVALVWTGSEIRVQEKIDTGDLVWRVQPADGSLGASTTAPDNWSAQLSAPIIVSPRPTAVTVGMTVVWTDALLVQYQTDYAVWFRDWLQANATNQKDTP